MIHEEGTVSESEVRDEVFASLRQSIVSASGLTMGMRRMTAFPYEMLKNTGRSASSNIYRAARNGMSFAKGNSSRDSGKHRNGETDTDRNG